MQAKSRRQIKRGAYATMLIHKVGLNDSTYDDIRFSRQTILMYKPFGCVKDPTIDENICFTKLLASIIDDMTIKSKSCEYTTDLQEVYSDFPYTKCGNKRTAAFFALFCCSTII